MKACKQYCPVESTLKVIGGKWKIIILWCLRDEIKRFSEIKREIPLITQKMLTQQLRELEVDGVIQRKVYAEVPPKVEYSMTDLGKSLKPVIEAMCVWGREYDKKTRIIEAV